jgi:hypothetical protein
MKPNLVNFFKRRWSKKLFNLREIDGEVNFTLRTRESGETMRNIENRLTGSARKLNLSWINAVRRQIL